MQSNKKTHRITIFWVIILIFGMQMIPSFTSGTFINSSDSDDSLRMLLLDESDYLFPPSPWIDDVSKDIDGEYVVDPEDYKSRFLPVYVRGDYALRGLWGRFNGVVGGYGTEDDPYVISGWEFEGRKFWKRFGRHYGITIENVDKHVVIKNNYIHDWWFAIGGDYISGAIDLNHCTNITVENNFVSNNLFSIHGCGNAIIQNNIVTENGYGIVCRDKVVARNNTIFNNYDDGVICNHANAYVAFNTVFSNGEDGIESMGGDRSLIEYNMMYDNSKDGILFGAAAGIEAHPTIANNEIFSNGRNGVCCYNPTEAIIRNNSVYSNFADGISCHSSNPTIIDNIISSNMGNGIHSYNGKPYIAHNLINLHRAGIYCRQSNAIITNNIITSNFDEGINCHTSHPQIHYNNIDGNDGYGVYSNGYMPFVNSTLNWWGAPDGPSGNGTGSGDPISNYIHYIPWFTEPNPYAGPR